MDIQARLGRRLAELREAKGLSHHQLAKEIGVTSQFIGRLETGERAPSIKVLSAVASALNVDPMELLRLDQSVPSKRTKTRDPLALVQLQGAARRLSRDDLVLVLALARRLGRGL